jgi:serine/threonine protein kinase
MGVVFLAHDATLHRQVALKLLESPTDDVTARARLLREARSAAAVNHPLGAAKGCFAQYDSEVQAALDRGYAEGGYQRGIIRATETIASQGIYVSPVDRATFYLMAGDNGRALEWLSKAVEIRDPNVGFVRDPNFDPLRGDLRFQALVRRIGLPN